MEITSTQIAFLALIFTAGAALAALFRLVNTSSEAVRKELVGQVDKVAANESKARHDLRNSLTAQLLKVDTKTERLEREMVRREDIVGMESRVTSHVSKLDLKVDALADKFDAKLDAAFRRHEDGRNTR